MKPIQLFDPPSGTYTYLLFDEASREALIIDPVDEQIERDLAELRTYGLKLAVDGRDARARRSHHQRGPAGRVRRRHDGRARGLRHHDGGGAAQGR